MRFKKGSMVEAWSTEESLMGLWRPGQILWGNGHTYILHYASCSPGSNAVSGRIKRKFIRPCPPAVAVLADWATGDVVEVFEDGSWKCAKVCQVVGKGCFYVRIMGSSKIVITRSVDLRVRQSWHDDEWFVIQKENQRSSHLVTNCEKRSGNCSLQVPQSCVYQEKHGEADGGRIGKDGGSRAPNMRSMKRKPSNYLMDVEGVQRVGSKKRIVEQDPGEGYVHASLNQMGRGKQWTRTVDCHRTRGTEEHDDTESIASSVGSCSPFSPISTQLLNFGSNSDAESEYCPMVREPLIDGNKELEEQIHHLELKAYSSTILAFYVSGPLSWEKETLLTHLRSVLNISNDEHLQVLRNLESSRAKIFVGLKKR